jgi:hypothetical protein
MKKLRNIYFIVGIFALAFALLTKHIPGVTATDFVEGFCYGLASALFLAGIVTAIIPFFYRNDKKKDKHAAKDGEQNALETSNATHDTGTENSDAMPHDPTI